MRVSAGSEVELQGGGGRVDRSAYYDEIGPREGVACKPLGGSREVMSSHEPVIRIDASSYLHNEGVAVGGRRD